MKRFLILLFVMSFCIPNLAFAYHQGSNVTIDMNKLTPDQVAELLKLQQAAEKPKAEKSTAAEVKEVLKPENLEEYAVLGQKVVRGVVAAAKEAGMAINEFTGTTVGRFCVLWISLKVFFSYAIWAFGTVILFLIGFTYLRPVKTRTVIKTSRGEVVYEDVNGKAVPLTEIKVGPRFQFQGKEAKVLCYWMYFGATFLWFLIALLVFK